ncbi:MAG: fumarylacetoacetase [Terriglobales bacterium]
MTAPAGGAAWLDAANAPDTDFPLGNLPYGVFHATGNALHPGVAIGDQIVDLAALAEAGALAALPEDVRAACRADCLNPLMGLSAALRGALRSRLRQLLAAGAPAEPTHACLVPQRGTRMALPARIGDYTDFYASIEHATTVGTLFRPTNPLLANYKYVPVGYHGRSSSVVVSGTPVRRPWGQRPGAGEAAPDFGPCRQLDYEVEAGLFVAGGNPLGEPFPLARAEEHAFGLCLLNDWSARDIQRWEYQPLGPFLGKNFATSISPWVVTFEALAPYRVPRRVRDAGDPAALDYLDAPEDRKRGGLDVQVEARLASAAMREQGMTPVLVSRANLAGLYWTLAQLLTHHASNGCNLSPGDLLGTGTVSCPAAAGPGPAVASAGSLLELTHGGRQVMTLPSGEQRTFLEDGDEVTLRAWCQRPGQARLGWGECQGEILPAQAVG